MSEKRAPYLDNESLLGEKVAVAFPAAISDIKEAGNCLAADCNTAAVFHLMRVVEFGLRALCVNLGLSRFKNRVKPPTVIPGKKLPKKVRTFTYQPIEYMTWERIISTLRKKVEQRVDRLRKGPRRQELEEFYGAALEEIEALKDTWRNHVMHTRVNIISRQTQMRYWITFPG